MDNSWNPNLTKENAVALVETKFWEQMTPYQIASFQLFQSRLCMPFDVFHGAVDDFAPGCSTISFGLLVPELQKAVRGDKGPPTLQEILDSVPESVRHLCQ